MSSYNSKGIWKDSKPSDVLDPYPKSLRSSYHALIAGCIAGLFFGVAELLDILSHHDLGKFSFFYATVITDILLFDALLGALISLLFNIVIYLVLSCFVHFTVQFYKILDFSFTIALLASSFYLFNVFLRQHEPKSLLSFSGLGTTGIIFACHFMIFFGILLFLSDKVYPRKPNHFALEPFKYLFFPVLLSFITLCCFSITSRLSFERQSMMVFEEPKKLEEKTFNIILILLDTLRADHLGAYGNPWIKTPNLDWVAQNGGTISNAYTNIPLTSPAIASIFSGLSPTKSYVWHNNMPYQGDEDRLLAAAYKRVGFKTAAFISGFPLRKGMCNLDGGFEIYDDYFSPYFLLPDPVFDIALFRLLDRLGLYKPMLLIERDCRATTERALAWIYSNYNRKFFMFLHYFDAHTPYIPSEQALSALEGSIPEHLEDGYFPREYERIKVDQRNKFPSDERRIIKAFYASEIEKIDQQIGKLLRALKNYSLLHKTILLIVSDHGESLGEHNYFFDHGRDLYQPCLHVPFVGYLPRAFPLPSNYRSGMCIDVAVDLVDLYPWIQRINGIAPRFDSEGESFYLAEGAQPDRSPAILSQTSSFQADGNRYFSVLEGNHKLITDTVGNLQLYDLDRDPLEQINLVDSKRKPKDYPQMLELLNDFKKEASREYKVTIQADPKVKQTLRTLGYLK